MASTQQSTKKKSLALPALSIFSKYILIEWRIRGEKNYYLLIQNPSLRKVEEKIEETDLTERYRRKGYTVW